MKIKTALSSLTYGEWKSHADSGKTALEILGITDDNFPVPSRWHTHRPDRGGKGWNDHKAGSLWWREDQCSQPITSNKGRQSTGSAKICYMHTSLWLSRHLQMCMYLLRYTHTDKLSPSARLVS